MLRQWFLQDSSAVDHSASPIDSAVDVFMDDVEYSNDRRTCVCVSKVTSSGVCMANGDTLTSIELSEEDRAQLLHKIEAFVLERGRYQKDGVWSNFKQWCAEAQQNRRYDVIIDGANVGYYKQNFAGAPGHVAYDQIDAMAKYLINRGYKPVIVLHR